VSLTYRIPLSNCTESHRKPVTGEVNNGGNAKTKKREKYRFIVVAANLAEKYKKQSTGNDKRSQG
jgi:hypothetical protein